MNCLRISFFLIFFLLIATADYGQKAKSSDENDLFSIKDPDFEVKDAPSKWSDESAVVLCQKIYLSYLRKAGGIMSGPQLMVEGSLRRRVKIQDKAALEEFSEFYFRKSNASGFQIVKADGKVVPIDMAQAVEVKTEVPSFYRSYYASSRYFKLAIPGLEIGDVIDYYYLFDEDGDHYDPVITTLGKSYPILHQEMKFNVDKGFYVSFNSYNGAPEIVKTGNGVDHRGRERKDAWAYVLTDRDREKYKSEPWDYEFLSEPTLKFQVYFMSNYGLKTTAEFVGEPGEAKNEVTKSDILKHLSRTDDGLPYDIKGYLKTKRIDNKDVDKLVNTAYYYARANMMMYFYYYADGPYGYPVPLEQFNYEQKPYIRVSDMYFVNSMLSVLKKNKVDAEIVVALPRKFGTLDDLLLASELQYGVYIESLKRLIFPFDNYSNAFDSNPMIEGTSAYLVDRGASEADSRFRKVKISVSTHEDNQFHNELKIVLTEDLQSLKVEKTSTIKGAQKSDYAQLALLGTDYVKAENNKFGLNTSLPIGAKAKKKTIENLQAKQKPAKEEAKKIQKEIFTELAEDDFGELEYGKFKLLSTGRFHTKPELKYEETFTVKEMVNKAGRNYIFQIGSLIGSQVELDQKQTKDRTKDVHYNYARSYINDITVEIPEGYIIEGVDQLNMDVDSESGRFLSTASIEGNKVKIHTEKLYKKNMVPKEDWSQMVDFLDASYNFTQKKVVLKKN